MTIYSPFIVYPPELDEIDSFMGEDNGNEDLFEDNPNELSPFELQYISEYSSRDIEEALFYEQGEPV